MIDDGEQLEEGKEGGEGEKRTASVLSCFVFHFSVGRVEF